MSQQFGYLSAVGIILTVLVCPSFLVDVSDRKSIQVQFEIIFNEVYKKFAAVSTEDCSHEDYAIQCQYDEKLVITKANYGHIRQGRCAKVDFGRFGCFVDVTAFMESKCFMQRSCTVRMLDVVDNNILPPCAEGLANFMDASHICVKGEFTFAFIGKQEVLANNSELNS